MLRRDFLASALAVPALGRTLHVPGGFSLQFGCAAITWGGKDDVAVNEISALGFRGIQLRAAAVERWGKDPQVLRDLLVSRQLALVCLSSGLVRLDPAFESVDMALHMKHAQFVRDVGGTFLQVVDERPRGRAPASADHVRMARLLSDIGKRTSDLGVTLAYHNHMGNLGQAPDEVDAVLTRVDARYVKLLLDIAHWHAAGGDPVAAIHRYHDRLAFLHLKDVMMGTGGAVGRTFRFVELGRGSVNVQGVLATLSERGYSGWGVVELDDPTSPGLRRAPASRSRRTTSRRSAIRPETGMHRRELLQWMVATGGLSALSRLSVSDLGDLGEDAHRRVRDRRAGVGALTAAELAGVAVIAECIIPRTETPGATDAGVAAFIDVMLAEWYPAEDLARVREKLADLDAHSRRLTREPFAHAPNDQQAVTVRVLDDDVARLRRADPAAANAHWFGILKYLTVWGYCTSEVAMRDVLHTFPPPMTYNGAAPLPGQT